MALPAARVEMHAADRAFFGHPRGLSTLFFTEMWERFSYYGMRGFLIFYMTAAASAGGMGLDVATAAAIYGTYTSMVYLMSVPGGWYSRTFSPPDDPSLTKMKIRFSTTPISMAEGSASMDADATSLAVPFVVLISATRTV